ncbi:MAG: DUF1778 domain-containing protein [Amaricoccus sp.]
MAVPNRGVGRRRQVVPLDEFGRAQWRGFRRVDLSGIIPYMPDKREAGMFGIGKVSATAGKMEARKEVRMHRRDEERIRAAAAATGVQEADFIRQAALMRAEEVERRLALSVLPEEAFAAFRAAVEGPGAVVPGLVRAAEASEGVLKDAG